MYPKGSLKVTLIVNSHGMSELVLMPRVNVDLSIATPQDVLDQLQADDSGRAQPIWAQLQGTSKVQFWKVLQEFSLQYGATIPFVFLEACQSGPYTFSDVWSIPSSVGSVGHAATRNIYPEQLLFSSITDSQNDFAAGLTKYLSNKGVSIDSKYSSLRWVVAVYVKHVPLVVYLTPLLLWVLWVLVQFNWPLGHKQTIGSTPGGQSEF
jgi:hypothetical protein